MLGDWHGENKKITTMKPLRRFIYLFFIFFSSCVFVESMIFLAPLQYLFTGKTTWIDNICDWIDNIANKINPDK